MSAKTKLDNHPSSSNPSKEKEGGGGDFGNIKTKVIKKMKVIEIREESSMELNGEKIGTEQNGVKGESDAEEEGRKKGIEEAMSIEEINNTEKDIEGNKITEQEVSRRTIKLSEKSEKENEKQKIEDEEHAKQNNLSGSKSGHGMEKEIEERSTRRSARLLERTEKEVTPEKETTPEKEEEERSDGEQLTRRSPRIALRTEDKELQEDRYKDYKTKEEVRVLIKKIASPVTYQPTRDQLQSLPPSYYRRRITGRRPVRSTSSLIGGITPPYQRKRNRKEENEEEERVMEKKVRQDLGDWSAESPSLRSPGWRYLTSTPFSKLWGPDKSQVNDDDSMVVNYDEETFQDVDIDVEAMEPPRSRSRWLCSIM